MGRASTKKDKNVYQLLREDLGLTREKASELLEVISPERIEKIESEKSQAHPDEILVMAEKYKKPSLRNYYCTHECPIGQRHMKEVKSKDLTAIVLRMLASMNAMQRWQERLIEIGADGRIQDQEIPDFIQIQEELNQISVMVETLKLWAEEKLAKGEINLEKYQMYKNLKGED